MAAAKSRAPAPAGLGELGEPEIPGGDLGRSVDLALGDARDALGPAIAGAAAEVAGSGEDQSAVELIAALLEAAERAEAHVHRLSRPVDGEAAGATAWGLAGGWLRARAAQLAAGLGPEQFARAVAALAEIAEGWMREARDLYDAGRSADRYMAATRGARGGLGSLAAALAGLQARRDATAVGRLAECGEGLAIAARMRDDLLELMPGRESAARPAGDPLLRGVYTLPVIVAVERDRELARSLGGAIARDDLDGLVGRIRAAGGPAEAADRCRRITEEALGAVSGWERSGPLAAIGLRIVTDCDQAVS